jgi:exodeoxyribonuclease V gamma subunit
MLAAWLHHLAQCLAGPDDAPLRTTVVARGDKDASAHIFALKPVADPADKLASLLELYWRGQCEPVLLFPRSSLAFCRALFEGKKLDAAMDEARKQWAERFNPERDDRHLVRLFGDADVLDPEFSLLGKKAGDNAFPQTAVRVFEPLLHHAEEG